MVPHERNARQGGVAYARLGFSHRYRSLGKDELLFVLDRHWKRPAGPSTRTTSQTPRQSPQ